MNLMETRSRLMALSLLLFSLPLLASGTQPIRLEGGSFDPLTARPAFAASLRMEGAAVPQDYGIVQFHQAQVNVARQALAARGIEFLGPVPEGAFIVRLTPAAREILKTHPAVRWVGEWEPSFKVQHRLWPESNQEIPEVRVVFFPGVSAEKQSRILAGLVPGAVRTSAIEDPATPRARFSLPRSIRTDFLRAAAADPAVYWIEPYAEPKLHNMDSSGPVQGGQAGDAARTIFAKGITGTGQIVAVGDSGCDSDQCFFRNLNGVTAVTDGADTLPPAPGPSFPTRKVFGYWIQPGATAYDNDLACRSGGSRTGFHGTHTSGTVVGDNLANPSSPSSPGIDVGDGMAPNAQLLFQDIGNDTTGCLTGLGDIAGMFQQAVNGGARIHSDSWGGSTEGEYTGDDRVVDRFLFDDERMAIFFSAGNDGAVKSTGSPANAKNGIAVGALLHGDSLSVASYSSRGPTADGRIKPDVMAPGSGIISAAGNTSHTDLGCNTKSLSGTSMACPTAAGAAALLRQYFADGFYPSGTRNAADRREISGPMVKAVLLNGSLPIEDFGNPDFGWGRVFLDNNLYFTGDARALRVFELSNTQGLKTGETRTYTVTVGAGQEFRATLVWMDPEGTLGAAKALVNDLDLVVVAKGVGTARYKGNVFAGGISTEGGTADRLNTVEQVRLASPVAGTYEITVVAESVPGSGRAYTDRQGYALVVSYAACKSNVTEAPAGLSAASRPDMGTILSFAPAPGSASTQIYRADGACPGSSASFQFIGSSTTGTFEDPRAQGGLTYSYLVRGADGCGEGPASSCVTITPAGRCDLLPEFSGIVSATANSPSCAVTLTWSPGNAVCQQGGGILRYNIYRDTRPDFTPGTANLRAYVLGGTTFVDQGPEVRAGTTYYYMVRAEDGNTSSTGPLGGNEDLNRKILFATPLGSAGTVGTFTDDGGDTRATLAPEYPWHISNEQANTGVYSYKCGIPGTTYPANTCASLTTPPLRIQSGATVSYAVSYNLEYQWDGVVVEASPDGGATWEGLPPLIPTGYPGKLSDTGNPPVNACRYPETQSAFTGPPNNDRLVPWSTYQSPLPSSYDGKDVLIRWRFSSDPGYEVDGFFLDDIAISGVRVPSSCQASGGGQNNQLLLSQGRIRVTVDWESQYSGEKGKAFSLPQVDQFGYFYFFDANNPEVFVKVLDFGNNKVQAFVGGLTDFGYRVTFTSVATGQQMIFVKPAGELFGFADGRILTFGPSQAASLTLPESWFGKAPAQDRALGVMEPAADPQEIVLSRGRITITVDWRNQYSGQTGRAFVIPQKDEFAYFYFFDRNNPEVFVKVLDFGSGSALLFVTGLTDFEYTVTFKNGKGDTTVFKKDAGALTGYANSQGIPF